MKKTPRTSAAIIAASCLAVFGINAIPAASAADVVTITLGASVPLTGSLAKEGLLTKEGYQFCQEKVNALSTATIGGKQKKIEIVFQDDTSKPDLAAQNLSKFNDKGIKLILSSYGSANVNAQAAVVELNKQTMVDSGGADDAIFNKGYTRTFNVMSPASEYATSMVRAIAEMAKPKPVTMAFLSADDGFSKTVTAGGMKAATALGFTVIGPQYFPNATSDVSAALNKIKADKPDVILGSVHFVEGVAMIKQAKELGITPKSFAETVAPPILDFASTLGPLAENVLGSSQWSSTVKGQEKYFGKATNYASEFLARFGHEATYHNAEASAACLAMVLAIEKTKSADAEKIKTALAALDVQSFFGRIKFDSTGQNTFKPMVVIQIQKGKIITVWPRSIAQAKMIWPYVK